MVDQGRQVAADQGDQAVAGVLAQFLGRQPGEGRLGVEARDGQQDPHRDLAQPQDWTEPPRRTRPGRTVAARQRRSESGQCSSASRSISRLLYRVHLTVGPSSSRTWGRILAALSGGHGVEDEQVLDLVALVSDEQVDEVVALPGGLQAGRRCVMANHDPGGGGRNQPCGRCCGGGSRTGPLAADLGGPEGEAERHADRKGQCRGQQEPSRERPPWWQGGPGRLRRACRRCRG